MQRKLPKALSRFYAAFDLPLVPTVFSDDVLFYSARAIYSSLEMVRERLVGH